MVSPQIIFSCFSVDLEGNGNQAKSSHHTCKQRLHEAVKGLPCHISTLHPAPTKWQLQTSVDCKGDDLSNTATHIAFSQTCQQQLGGLWLGYFKPQDTLVALFDEAVNASH